MNDVSLINDDVRAKIRTCLLNGEKIIDIQAKMGISPSTWDVMYWKDYKGFRTFVLDCHDERLRTIARQNIDDIVSMPDNPEDVRYLKIKADMTTFVAETVDKERFSKKTDDKGDERTPINIQVNTYKKIKALKKSLPKPSKP